MPSKEAVSLWAEFEKGPKQVDLDLAARRLAGEHAEDVTSEPIGVNYRVAPEVDGIWAEPVAARKGVTILYLFGGGYVLGSPASRRKTAADLGCEGESMHTRAGVDIMCTRDSLLEMVGWYLGSHEANDPLASPVHADLGNLPPLLALVGSDEVLLDDARRLVVGVAEGGADATLFIGAGMQHVWPTWAGALPEADAAIAMIGEWVRAHTS